MSKGIEMSKAVDRTAATDEPSSIVDRSRDPDGSSGLDVEGLRAAVLAWYDRHGRSLAFRGTKDPYLVLASETILQQTQISRGAPAWEAFVERFPTVESLAAATPADVLRAWAGLGYNRRALNLHRAARVVVGELGGRFPQDVDGLERLPGVGRYTARAVASIAYGQPVGAVDTNVRRVLGRALAVDPQRVSAREMQGVADALVPSDRSADWTHGLMDVGSMLCRPQTPRCSDCPVRPFCRFAAGDWAAAESRSGPLPGSRSSFKLTNRWLRGRILARLREVDGDAWAEFADSLGDHSRDAVQASLRTMGAEGLLELDTTGAFDRARLPLA